MVEEDEVLAAAQAAHGPSATFKFTSEVFWRTYWKGYLEQRPALWTSYRAGVARGLELVESNSAMARAFQQAIEGRTGIDAFDAWVATLTETGYLHNHARMWFASIWIFTLRLPWELGADFFLRRLLDGDPASNTLSWRWVAGLHTAGKIYLATADNIDRYTDGRFAPKGLATRAEALREETSAPLVDLPAADAPPQGGALLLLSEDDLHPESLDVASTTIVAAVAGHAAGLRSPEPASELVRNFTNGAVADALARAAAYWDVPSETVPLEAAPVVAAAAHAGVRAIVTPYAPVGPAADAVGALRPALDAAGVRLHCIRRPFDEQAWPHCRRGFFQLSKAIPELLAGLDAG